PFAQYRYASIHSAPCGGGLGSGRSKMPLSGVAGIRVPGRDQYVLELIDTNIDATMSSTSTSSRARGSPRGYWRPPHVPRDNQPIDFTMEAGGIEPPSEPETRCVLQ